MAPAHSGIRELHEVRSLQHGGLLAPPDAPALRDAKGLLVPVRVGRTQALPKKKKKEKKKNAEGKEREEGWALLREVEIIVLVVPGR